METSGFSLNLFEYFDTKVQAESGCTMGIREGEYHLKKFENSINILHESHGGV